MRNKQNLKSTNLRSTTIIQVPNMNLKLNMKDINRILAKSHLKCNYFFNYEKKQHIFAETCLYDEVYLSCLHFSLMFSEGEVKAPCFLQVWWALHNHLKNWIQCWIVFGFTERNNEIKIKLKLPACIICFKFKGSRKKQYFLWPGLMFIKFPSTIFLLILQNSPIKTHYIFW